MKPIHQHFIAAALLLLFAFQASAQTPIDVTFTPPINTPALGATFSVQVKVVNFKNIGSFQFPITFNQNVIELVSVTNPASALAPFNTVLTLDPNGNNVFLNPGRLAVSWQSNPNTQPNGVTLAANASLFTLNFKALTNGVTTINIAGPPVQPNLEVTTAAGASVTVNYVNGGASVTSGSGGVTPPVTAIYGFHIIANTIFIPQGEIGCMPVTANDFEGIQSALYAMYWDAPTLELVATRNYGLPGTIDFGVNNPGGRLATSWGTPTGLPITRPDLSTLYEVCYKAEGPAGASTLVSPNGNGFNPPVNAEVVNATGMDIWKDTTGIKDTIFIVSNPAPSTSVNYIGEMDTVITGQTTCVDVRLKNFSNATYGEFAMTYDTTKLKFSSISLGANPLGLSLADTATNNFVKFFRKDVLAPNGEDVDTLRYIHFSYRKPAGAGTVADNTVPFSVCFKAIGPESPTPTVVKISSFFDLGNALVPIGAAKKTIGSVPVAVVNGSVVIKSASTLSAVTTVQNVTCAGGTNGAINLTVNNCTGTATYLWSNGAVTKNISGLAAGSYTVTVTCSVGGTTTTSATVSQPAAINLPAPTITNITCFGGNNGAITVAPIGGTGGYTYLWSGPGGYTSTNQNISNLSAGQYKVTVTDNSGCTIAANSISAVTAPSPIVIPTNTATMVAVKCKGGSDGSITLPTPTGGNTGAFTFAWSGPGGFMAATQNISGLKAGNYSVVVTDSKGCTAGLQSPLVVTEPAQAVTISTPVPSNIKCFGASDGSIQINMSGGTGTYTYSWKNVATNAVVSTVEDPTNLPAGTYAVTATDANQCTSTSTPSTITAPTSALTVTETHVDAACSNIAGGCIDLTISGGWNNPTVAWNNPLLPSIADPCNILPGAYVATVTDGGGCTVTIPVTVGSAPAISLNNSTVVTNVKCHGEANGGIVINPTGGGAGPYEVTWSPGGLSGTAISGLAGGSYTPIVTNVASGCTAVFDAIVVAEPSAITVTSVPTMQTGSTNNGKIDLTSIAGGTPSYQINWTGPGGFTSTQQNIANLAPGDYVLNITDANLCTYTTTINVPAENPLAPTAFVLNNACDKDACISVSVAANATATPFVFSWGGGTPTVTSDHTATICGLAPGVYNVTVSDAAGHTAVLAPLNVTQLAPANAGSVLNNPHCASMDGSIILDAAGSPLTYKWENGSNAAARVSLDAGTYVVTVTNALSACTSVDTFTLARIYPAAVGAFGTITPPNCASSATGVIDFNFTGGNSTNCNNTGYSYAWSGPNNFTANTKNISGLAPGTYTVTVTDLTPTTYTYSTTLTATSLLAVTNVTETSSYGGGYQVSTATACDGKATVSFSGASGAASILWSNGATTASTTTLCGGAYTVTVTDQAGCSSVWSDELTTPDALATADASTVTPSCSGKCDGVAQFRVSGGVAPYTVRWALPGNQFQQDVLNDSFKYSTVNNLCGGTYKVTITDNNGGTSVQSVTVAEPTPITATFNQNPPTRFNSCDAETIINVIGAASPISYAWSGSNSHSGEEARADNLCAGEVVEFAIVDNNGCTATLSDTINYPEDGCLLGSPVITPGEKDGKNDELFITCAETLNNTVEIFNRWGQMVYSVQNYDNNSIVWTGETKSGAALPEGVYFYIMTYTDDQGTQQRIKGYVNLLR